MRYKIKLDMPSHKDYEITQSWLRETEKEFERLCESDYNLVVLGASLSPENELKKAVIDYLQRHYPLSNGDLNDLKVHVMRDYAECSSS